MKIKNKAIIITIIMVTMLNILNISYAGNEDNSIRIQTKEEKLNSDLNDNLVEQIENSEENKQENVTKKEESKQQISDNEELITKNEKVEEKDTVIIGSGKLETVDECQLHIINVDENNNPIVGNKYTVLRTDLPGYDAKDYLINLTTNEQGKIDTTLFIGKFYIKQTHSVDGYSINKSLIELTYEKGENITLTIVSQKPTTKETTKILDKQINYTEKNNNTIENNVTNNSDIVVTNNNKEIINETNTTKWNNVSNFINTIDRNNILTLGGNTTYNNSTQESNLNEPGVETITIPSNMTKLEFMNYINEIMSDSGIPILPVASK